jgi:DNA-directed RNA polymerase specialized sigma subunit
MSANIGQPLTARLKEELKKRKKKVSDFERETGIDKEKVYKWLKRGTTKIDLAEVKIIEDWISGQTSNVSHENTDNIVIIDKKQSLEKSIENLTENELRTTAVIERLVALLEQHYGKGPTLAPPGTPGTETLNPRKNKKPAD